MQRIKFITDTASDIPDELLLEYDIDMLSVPIAIEGRGYYERRSFTIQEFYRILARSAEIPSTSRVPSEDYLKGYERAFNHGFTDIINVTMNASGSGTYDSARMAVTDFFEAHPEAKNKLRIHVVDSGTYSMTYGYPIVEGARMARAGVSVSDILAYLNDFFDSVEIYLACYSLEYAKKSGRITAAAAFVGDALGMRPIIAMVGGTTKIIDRVRGDKNVMPQLLKRYEENCGAPDSFVIGICGEVDEYGLQLRQALQKSTGREIRIYRAGASIVINSGPKIAAVAFRGKKRR